MSKPAEKGRSQAVAKETPVPSQAQPAEPVLPADPVQHVLAQNESLAEPPQGLAMAGSAAADEPGAGDQPRLYVALSPISHDGERFDPEVNPFLRLSSRQAQHLLRVGAVKRADPVDAP